MTYDICRRGLASKMGAIAGISAVVGSTTQFLEKKEKIYATLGLESRLQEESTR